MTQKAEKILLDAMELDEAERIAIGVKLLETVPDEVDADYVESWEKEIAARLQDIDSGRAKSYPLDQAMRMIRGGGKIDEAD